MSNSTLLKCDICGSDQLAKYKIKNTIFRCKKCGFFFSKEPNFNRNFMSDVSPASMESSLRKLRIQNYGKIIPVIKNYFEKKKIKGLEIGSSYGWFLETSRKHNIDCEGIEPEEKTYLISLSKHLRLQKGFFPQDITRHKKYDFIIFNDTFEHIPDFKSCLKASRKFLKSGGLLIINMPLSSGIFYRIGLFLTFFGIDKFLNRLWQFDFHSPHYYYFNKANFALALKNHGYDSYKYIRLETLVKDDLKGRLAIDSKLKNKSALLEKMIALIVPFLALLPEDIGCFFAVKNESRSENKF